MFDERPQPPALVDADQFGAGLTLHPIDFPKIHDGHLGLFGNLHNEWPGIVIPVTNRPGYIAQRFADMVMSPLAVAESGARVIAFGNIIHDNQTYEYYHRYTRSKIISLVNELIEKRNLKQSVEQLRGNYVTACFFSKSNGVSLNALRQDIVERFDKDDLLDEIDIEPTGINIDIHPKGLTKASVVDMLFDKGILQETLFLLKPPEIVIAGDDSGSAIHFFEQLKRRVPKAIFFTNANGSRDLQDWVQDHNGIISSLPYNAGVVDALSKIARERLHLEKKGGIWVVSKPLT